MVTGLTELLPELSGLYEDLHEHPELSFAEHRTAAEMAGRLRALGCTVSTGVGGTGVVGVLRNGPGPVVLLRADMDGLPVAERTGLPYASTVTARDASGRDVPVMHACGHDLHLVWLLGAATLLAEHRAEWSGTVLAVCQPAEELGAGAAAMVDDGLFERFGRPDVILGQHVFPFPAGAVRCGPGPVMGASDTLRVRLYGRGGHGSRPETTVDPIVMTAATIMRLQTVVSREVGAAESAVVTAGMLRGGDATNVIPAEAEFTVNMRTLDEAVRVRVDAAVRRIVHGEAVAAGAPREPSVELIRRFDPVVNDAAAAGRVAAALRERLGTAQVTGGAPVSAAEDFGVFGRRAGVPSVFWLVGGADPRRYAEAEQAGRLDADIPSNHSPLFAPSLKVALPTGVETLLAAALAWLGR